MDPSAPPPVAPEAYREACARLAALLADSAEARLVAELLERIVRYEVARGLPAEERFPVRPAAEGTRRTALVSDIHGNIDGLRAVLADIDSQRCERIICLGDQVEGGGGNEDVVALLRERGVKAVRGNHDEHNDVVLAPATRAYLAGLPESIVDGDVHFTHISPRACKRKVNHAVEAWNVFEDAAFRVLFIGHVHVPLLFAATSPHFGEAGRIEFEYNRPVALDPAERYIACVGSAGYGRDMVGKLRYAIHDRGSDSIEFRAIDGPLLPMDDALRGPAAGYPAR